MANAITAAKESEVADASKPPASPRKRRRRAPASGAADDCFACLDLRTPCDRRRPYCTQCLDRGKDCSGYKTTLTWGVGVASRGKLRGLALPIAQSKKVDPVEKDPPQKSGKADRTSPSTAGTTKHARNSRSITSIGPASTAGHTDFGFINVDPNAPAQSPLSMSQPSTFRWNAPTHSSRPANRTAARPLLKRGVRRHSLTPIQMPALNMQEFKQGPMTAHMFGGYGDLQYDSGPDYSPTAGNSPTAGAFPLLSPPMPMIPKSYPGEQAMHRLSHGTF